MTKTEMILLGFIVFQQAMLFMVLALQKSINTTIKETLALILKGRQS